jgi:hypothetical protein
VSIERVEVAGDPPVRGGLHVASGADGLVLTHGAGGNKDTPLLVAAAEAFAARGVSVLRCDLPFRQARKGGAPSPSGAARDRAGLRAALAVLRQHVRGRLFLGGHSYGGRQASMLLAEDPSLAHALLPQIRTATLFVHGTADPFATADELERARALILARTAVLSIAAGHDLGWSGARRDAGLPERIVTAFFDLAGQPGEAPSSARARRS